MRGKECLRCGEVILTIKLKRAYDRPSRGDGTRILVDRLWPRGLGKEGARIDVWSKNIAPSADLRKWFNHEPEKWDLFRRRYFAELDGQLGEIGEIVKMGRKGTVTLLFGSKEERYNNAAALREYIEARMQASGRNEAA
jgi:uncharacterized protein YeaO (DUF488 family)